MPLCKACSSAWKFSCLRSNSCLCSKTHLDLVCSRNPSLTTCPLCLLSHVMLCTSSIMFLCYYIAVFCSHIHFPGNLSVCLYEFLVVTVSLPLSPSFCQTKPHSLPGPPGPFQTLCLCTCFILCLKYLIGYDIFQD